jgi:hypothetical protein
MEMHFNPSSHKLLVIKGRKINTPTPLTNFQGFCPPAWFHGAAFLPLSKGSGHFPKLLGMRFRMKSDCIIIPETREHDAHFVLFSFPGMSCTCNLFTYSPSPPHKNFSVLLGVSFTSSSFSATCHLTGGDETNFLSTLEFSCEYSDNRYGQY